MRRGVWTEHTPLLFLPGSFGCFWAGSRCGLPPGDRFAAGGGFLGWFKLFGQSVGAGGGLLADEAAAQVSGGLVV